MGENTQMHACMCTYTNFFKIEEGILKQFRSSLRDKPARSNIQTLFGYNRG